MSEEFSYGESVSVKKGNSPISGLPWSDITGYDAGTRGIFQRYADPHTAIVELERKKGRRPHQTSFSVAALEKILPG